MSAFRRYARYYDLLNRGKDYAAEARFVDELLAGGGQARGTLLDVGCGTGAHAREFARLGWRVTGVDLSADMIQQAAERTPAELAVGFAQGAAADFDLRQQFDAVVSLFHVASYQADAGELLRMLRNIRRHIRAGGRLVFDFWHGGGVRADPPGRRERTARDDELKVTRVATPTHDPQRQIIEVRYDIVAEQARGGAREEIKELHRMRYYFRPEIEESLREAGFALEQTRSGLTPEPLSETSWYGLVVARAAGTR